MAGSKDIINELITNIESQKWDYVIGIFKPKKSSKIKDLDIYTNIGDAPLEKLLFVLEEFKKSNKNKLDRQNNQIKEKDE